MKKVLVLLLLLVVLLGCTEKKERDKVVSVTEPVTITYWGNVSPEWTAIYRAFEDQYPNITIQESLNSNDWASSSEKFLAAIAAGNAPDVSLQNRHQFKQWASQGPFYDLTELAENEDLAADYYPVQYGECTFNGKLFGLPDATDARFLFWNKTLFKEAGLDPEAPPKTWGELEEMTKILTKRNSADKITQHGFLPYYGNTWTWWYGWLNGGEFLSEDQKTVTSTDPRIVEALDWMVNFYNEHSDGMQNATGFLEGFQNEAVDPFVAGKLAMYGNGDWQLSTLNTFPDLDYGMTWMPVPDTESATQVTWSCGGAQAISANTKSIDAAWTFLKWITGEERYRLQATIGLQERQREWEREDLPGSVVFVPPLTTNVKAAKMFKDEFVSKLPMKVQDEYKMALDSLNQTRGCGETMGLVGLVYWNEMHQATENALYGKMSAYDALELARVNVQKALDNAWRRVK